MLRIILSSELTILPEHDVVRELVQYDVQMLVLFGRTRKVQLAEDHIIAGTLAHHLQSCAQYHRMRERVLLRRRWQSFASRYHSREQVEKNTTPLINVTIANINR